MKTNPPRRLATLAACALALGSAPHAARAANLVWGKATTITGDTDIVNTGTLLGALRLGSTGLTPATVNGVTFLPLGVPDNTNTVTSGVFTINLGLSYSTPTNTEAGTTAAPFANLPAATKNLLQAGTFSQQDRITLTMSGLVVGQAYTFEWETSNSGNFTGSSQALTQATGGTGVVSLLANSTANRNMLGGIGQFAVGTFTADAATQVITFVSNNDLSYLTDFELRSAVPEPATWLGGALLGGLAVAGARRRVRRA